MPIREAIEIAVQTKDNKTPYWLTYLYMIVRVSERIQDSSNRSAFCEVGCCRISRLAS